MKAKAAA